MKKWLSLFTTVLVFLMLLPANAGASAVIFKDISPKHRAYEATRSLYAKGVFDLDEDGKARPGKYIRPNPQRTTIHMSLFRNMDHRQPKWPMENDQPAGLQRNR